MSDSASYVVVIGGANIDISGTPSAPLVAKDSNPGTVRMSFGGVGRNIAHNLALLGVDVRFITAFGSDLGAQSLKASCQELGIDISHSITVEGQGSSSYLFITDDSGEMQLAVNDMGILEYLGNEHLAAQLDLLRGAAVVVIDTNLPRETLAWLTSQEGITYFCDPISSIKAEKLEGFLGGIHTLKPNLLEAELISGVPIKGGYDYRTAAKAMLEQGLDQVFLSMGNKGLYALNAAGEDCLLTPRVVRTVNTNGAGDAMMAALVWAHLQDEGLAMSARLGMAASALCVESEETVSPSMNVSALVERMVDM